MSISQSIESLVNEVVEAARQYEVRLSETDRSRWKTASAATFCSDIHVDSEESVYRLLLDVLVSPMEQSYRFVNSHRDDRIAQLLRSKTEEVVETLGRNTTLKSLASRLAGQPGVALSEPELWDFIFQHVSGMYIVVLQARALTNSKSITFCEGILDSLCLGALPYGWDIDDDLMVCLSLD